MSPWSGIAFPIRRLAPMACNLSPMTFAWSSDWVCVSESGGWRVARGRVAGRQPGSHRTPARAEKLFHLATSSGCGAPMVCSNRTAHSDLLYDGRATSLTRHKKRSPPSAAGDNAPEIRVRILSNPRTLQSHSRNQHPRNDRVGGRTGRSPVPGCMPTVPKWLTGVTQSVPMAPISHTQTIHPLLSLQWHAMTTAPLSDPGLVQALSGLCPALATLRSPMAERGTKQVWPGP